MRGTEFAGATGVLALLGAAGLLGLVTPLVEQTLGNPSLGPATLAGYAGMSAACALLAWLPPRGETRLPLAVAALLQALLLFFFVNVVLLPDVPVLGTDRHG